MSDELEYHALHIAVETEDEARAILAELAADPSRFGAIAKARSKDPRSAALGGDLGWGYEDDYAEAFAEALVKLRPGQLSDIVASQYGFHVIKLANTRPARPRDED
ncbi:peptidylprolyl isomerase [Embleya sp. NBC_00896]|uniref:peptidylprolyl isomerase n=1 Tax=Embleya sp. NBC_00896 TaxID=2975961 RepID=UPI002F914E06|nr:peptidylprolyl isomerase [Embleya sp. NBC_00896]